MYENRSNWAWPQVNHEFTTEKCRCMLEFRYRLTLFAGFIAQKKKPIGSKRWLKTLKTWRNWNLQPHNIASLYNTSLFAKLQFYLIELFTSEQCRNRPKLRSSDSKQAKTRILNKGIKRQTWMKLHFAVLNS